VKLLQHSTTTVVLSSEQQLAVYCTSCHYDISDISLLLLLLLLLLSPFNGLP